MTLVRATFYDDLLTRANPRPRELEVGPETRLLDLVERLVAEMGLADRPEWRRPSLLVNGYARATRDIAPEELVYGDGRRGIVELRLAPARPGDPATAVLAFIAFASAVISYKMTPRVRPQTSSDPLERRSSFGLVSHNAVAGDAIPVVLGRKRRYGGKVIARLSGEGEDGDARLKVLIMLGHGPVEQIGSRTLAEGDFDRVAGEALSAIFINDQPISSFPGILVSARFGAPGQEAIPAFKDAEVTREVGVGGAALENSDGADRTGSDASGEAFTFTTVDAVDAVVLRVRFPRGVFGLSAAGQVNSRRVQYRARTRTADVGSGAGSWSAWTVVTVDKAEQSEVYSAKRLGDLAGSPAVMDVQVERVTAAGDSAVADDMIWDSLVEVRLGENNYEGIAVLALELTASEQLASPPSVSIDHKGYAALRIWDGESPPDDPEYTTGWSDNAADHALEVITNTTWGMGGRYTDADVNLASLFQCRQEAAIAVPRAVGGGTRPKFACNLVMGEQRDGIDWLRAICATMRAVPMPVGKVWHFVQDRARSSPVERFGEGDIARDDKGESTVRYRRQHTTGGRVRPNRLTAQLDNAEQGEENDVLAYPNYGQLWLGGESPEPVLEEARRYEGVTDIEQLAAELVYELKGIRGQSRSVAFETTKPVVVVQPGERFDLAVSLAGWGRASGRLLTGCTATHVRIDKQILFDAGVTYRVKISRLDNTVEIATITAVAATVYAVGTPIPVRTGLSGLAEEGASYSIGAQGVEDKPFLCTKVTPVDTLEMRWELEGVEYAEDVYDSTPGEVELPDYSDLPGIFTPPGPVLSPLRAYERSPQVVVGGGRLRNIVLAWRQSPADAQITATFRIYRRVVGTTAWVSVPAPSVTRTGTVIELADVDRAYQFVVVAVSAAGSALSPYDPRHPVANLVLGLAAPPPPPPEDLAITQVSGNTYKLTWTAVEGAAGYQVLAGGDTTALPNVGAESCLVVARTVDPELLGLELAPGVACRFWVRSVGDSGRLSFTASTVAIATPATPGGESVKDTEAFDLENDGTLTNLDWDGTDERLELDNPAADGVYLSEVIDTGSLTLGELTLRPATANDAADPLINTDPFDVASIAADQWGVVSGSGQTAVVGMLMPPWPDAAQTWVFEVRTSDDNALWTDWTALAAFRASVRRVFRYYQVRATMRRASAPYRPALRGLTAVVTH